MLSFFRSLLQVALGFALGFLAAAYYLPEARSAREHGAGPVVKGPTATVAKPGAGSQGSDTPAASNLFGRPSTGSLNTSEGSTVVKSPKEPVIPAKESVVEEVAQPKPGVVPVLITDQPPVVEEPVDFRELCIKPAAWPPSITLNKDVNAEVIEGEEVIAEIPLSAGERVQVSKVFGDGTVEVRAKGAKFVLKASDTDLSAQARQRLAEISGRTRAPAPTERPEPKPEVKPVEKPAPVEPPKATGDDLDRKMKSLFGSPQKRSQ